MVYDIGANIGYISLVLAKAVGEGGRVMAFEALPANLNRLHENLHLNRLGKIVQVVPGAVGEVSGEVQFLVAVERCVEFLEQAMKLGGIGLVGGPG